MGKTSEEAGQVFRQFAWNLAGTLANAKAGGRKVARPTSQSQPVAKS